ncbi:hypothetical protein MHF_0319 [Mycoplasma haemofelis Ohio2]|uniref:Secreted protein n=1 Tax=Mycoplasma haemofelis (strain Ohio2) TaxID=859194 RepID=F6FGS5_MYCHI|nr:hypothetical protein MHF_0319 [Mycoplasma haemofelis Ohio2]
MTTSTLTKVALGMGAASATAAGVAYAGGAFSPSGEKEEVVSRLIKTANPGKRVIVTTDVNDSNWKEAWKLYREDNKDKNVGEDIWKLKDWTKPDSGTINNTDQAPASFISECHSRSSNKTIKTDSNLYKEVLRYCTKDTQVSDLIAENNKDKTLLDTSSQSGDSSPSADWINAWEVYKKYNEGKGASADAWQLESWESKKAGTVLPSDFKTKCATKLQTKTFDLNNEDYRGVLAWCTK